MAGWSNAPGWKAGQYQPDAALKAKSTVGKFKMRRMSPPPPAQGTLFDPEEFSGEETPDTPTEGVGPVDDWDYYWPTKTSNPPRPRTTAARYSKKLQRIEVQWRDGGVPYHYDNVHPNTWRGFKRTDSPGRYINRILNGHDYGPGGWGLD